MMPTDRLDSLLDNHGQGEQKNRGHFRRPYDYISLRYEGIVILPLSSNGRRRRLNVVSPSRKED